AIAAFARQAGFQEIYVPETNAAEAALVTGLKVYAVISLAQLLRHLAELDPITVFQTAISTDVLRNARPATDMQDIAGQELAKRALEIASSGGHNLTFKG